MFRYFVNDLLPKEGCLPFFNVKTGSWFYFLNHHGYVCKKQIQGGAYIVPLLNVGQNQIIDWSHKMLQVKTILSNEYIGCYIDGGDDRGRNLILYIERI